MGNKCLLGNKFNKRNWKKYIYISDSKILYVKSFISKQHKTKHFRKKLKCGGYPFKTGAPYLIWKSWNIWKSGIKDMLWKFCKYIKTQIRNQAILKWVLHHFHNEKLNYKKKKLWLKLTIKKKWCLFWGWKLNNCKDQCIWNGLEVSSEINKIGTFEKNNNYLTVNVRLKD